MDNGTAQQEQRNQVFDLDQYNLDTNEWNAAPTMQPQQDPRTLGNRAIFTPEAAPTTTPPETAPIPATPNATPAITAPETTTPELGQITPVMPPGYAEPDPQTVKTISAAEATPDTPPPATFTRTHAMSGDRLSTKAIDTLQNRERELAATGDIAAFVDYIDAARAEFQGKQPDQNKEVA